MTIFDLSDVRIVSGDRIILDSITLSFGAGERVVLLGRSGSGKSSLIKLLAGLWHPTAGTIDRYSQKSPTRIGYVSQTLDLWSHLSARDHLALCRHGEGTEPANVDATLDLLGIAALSHIPARQLSGGQRQRLALGRALVTQPNVLLLDELTSALDPVTAKALLDVLKSFSDSKRLVVLATHNVRFARAFATRTIFLEDGVVSHDGTLDDVAQKPAYAAFIRDAEIL
jgi:polar amino acid transport system ATP-binding protein